MLLTKLYVNINEIINLSKVFFVHSFYGGNIADMSGCALQDLLLMVRCLVAIYVSFGEFTQAKHFMENVLND